MKKFAALLLAVLMMFGTVSALAGGSLVIYSPHDADPLQAGIALFQAAYPDIKVEYIAAGTGELLQRVVAESENPLADVLWGGGADSLAAFKPYFQPYVSANDDVIADAFKDAEDLWIGESPLPMVLFYNKNLVKEDEAPKGWEDLLNPKWKGMIAYASPAKSGSAYTQLCTMILAQGGPDGGGWDFVEKFYQNLDGKVQDSSGNCHKLVASGEYAIGVTIEKSAVLYADNPDVAFVYPAQNSAVPDGVAIIKNAPNLENAKLFVDFVTGLECQKDQNVNWKRRPVRSDLEPVGLLPLSELDLTNYDFDWAANEKETIIEKWQEIIVNN
jgi:iron(III) transport system substrate-binding protein